MPERSALQRADTRLIGFDHAGLTDHTAAHREKEQRGVRRPGRGAGFGSGLGADRVRLAALGSSFFRARGLARPHPPRHPQTAPHTASIGAMARGQAFASQGGFALGPRARRCTRWWPKARLRASRQPRDPCSARSTMGHSPCASRNMRNKNFPPPSAGRSSHKRRRPGDTSAPGDAREAGARPPGLAQGVLRADHCN